MKRSSKQTEYVVLLFKKKKKNVYVDVRQQRYSVETEG